MTERDLQEIVLLKLQEDLLPREESRRIWAGPGNSEACSACDTTITKKQTVYEWECDGRKIKMHIACYELWNTLRQ